MYFLDNLITKFIPNKLSIHLSLLKVYFDFIQDVDRKFVYQYLLDYEVDKIDAVECKCRVNIDVIWNEYSLDALNTLLLHA